MTVLNLASERCVATDEICVKGVRGCFLDKRFIGSCVMQEPINFARVGTAVLAKYVFTWSLFSSQSKALCEAVNPLICRKLYS